MKILLMKQTQEWGKPFLSFLIKKPFRLLALCLQFQTNPTQLTEFRCGSFLKVNASYGKSGLKNTVKQTYNRTSQSNVLAVTNKNRVYGRLRVIRGYIWTLLSLKTYYTRVTRGTV